MSDFRGIEEKPIDELIPYSKNAKKHPDGQVEAIANSIRMAGFVQPVVIDKDNVVVIGHGRLLGAKKAGLDTVPCIRVDDLTPEQVKALRLADNKLNESDWDYSLLSEEIDEILNIDLTDLGFNEAELLEIRIDDPLEELRKEPEPIPDKQEAVTGRNVGDGGNPGADGLPFGGGPSNSVEGNSSDESVSREELKAYSEHASEMLARRVIIIYKTDDDEAFLKALLRIHGDGRLPVSINVDALR